MYNLYPDSEYKQLIELTREREIPFFLYRVYNKIKTKYFNK